MSGFRLPLEADCWLPYVQAYVQAYELGARLSSEPAGTSPSPCEIRDGLGETPLVVLCSPHPDDEMLTGALPLRMRRELGARVVNVAVTLGSDRSRQDSRWQELQAACTLAGFECRQLALPLGFNLKAGQLDPGWQDAVQALADVFAGLSPDLVVLPHAEDHHPAHVATHGLVTAALASSTAFGAAVTAVETEYWRPMAAPNLLVGLGLQDLAWQLAALACHRGEIERNPYHLTQPARMMDTVRRGAELVKGGGPGRPGFLFGELYRLVRWQQGKEQIMTGGLGWVGPEQGLETMIQGIAPWTSR